ncbi:MAG: KpsF/GutQ family sugar-phosphate isomerase [Planctomycetota bacterium]|nr:KpsF/GutQ family sugar-phosphate isomerase [Planctomycetota bacterium]
MSQAAIPHTVIPFSRFEQLRHARSILLQEADAVRNIAASLDTDFCAAVELIWRCEGSVIVTGMGKAGLIGRKIAATLSSTGTRAHCLHPAEAVHGDIGCVHADDVVLALSNSGETEEVSRLLPILERLGVPVVAITADADSTLGAAADAVIKIGRLTEADTNGLAPSTSTTVMLAVGDALALVVSQLQGFTSEDFAGFHPGGSLGQKLRAVADAMRPVDEVRIANQDSTVRDVLTGSSKPGRRTGAVMLIDTDGTLVGLFTDSDLTRLLEQRRDNQLDQPIAEVMTPNPITINVNKRLSDAVDVLSDRKLSELPVVDDAGRPVGLIDITDLIGLIDHDQIREAA